MWHGMRWITWQLVGGVLLIAGLGIPASQAEPVGGPSALLKKGQWSFGLGAGGVLGRSAKGAGDPREGLYSVEHFRGYGLTDWLSVYGKVGWAYLRVTDSTALNNVNDFGSNLLLGAQLKNRFWRSVRNEWEWDGSVQYLWVGVAHRRGKNQAQWQEWQFATSVAKPFGRLKPYVGLKTSLVNLDFHLRRGGKDAADGAYKQDGWIGPMFGTDYAIGEDTVVNVETAYINGADVSVAVGRNF